ncbi:hypothetical protein [uncultured Sneathiella sp.]|jgi:hypothetical protein|uniref:hypothetical protein n=1 Tax=uncultured Sneathiella sp. TaxID=879315 RepID=UPI0030D8EFA4|tara:strand:+ start:24261 stop:24965 length:705 start_codon:yes stop_codon:yes gene_type:complete
MALEKGKAKAQETASFKAVKREWDRWRRDKTHITTKLHKTYIRKSDWFLTTHAASEAALRRLIFIGLRQKKVPYDSVQTWMDGHSITYGKQHGHGTFIVYFDRLYARSWADTMKAGADLEELWKLWNDYSKPVRNGLAHGARKYSDDWLDVALSIDRLFMMRLDHVISPVLGGTAFADLRKLTPRLGRGNSNISAEAILNIQPNRVRETVPLDEASNRLDAVVKLPNPGDADGP